MSLEKHIPSTSKNRSPAHIMRLSQRDHNGQIMCATSKRLTIASSLILRQDTNPDRPSGLQNFQLTLPEDQNSGQLKGIATLFIPTHFTTFCEYIKINPIFVRGTELVWENWPTNRTKMDRTTRLAILESPYVPRRERDIVTKRSKEFGEVLQVFRLEWGRKGLSSGGLGGPQQVFTVYFQHQYDSLRGEELNRLYFADELQTILIALEDRSRDPQSTDLIRIPYTHIKFVERCEDGLPAMIFHLHSSVIFERYLGGQGSLPRPPRLIDDFHENGARGDGERLTGLNSKHARVLPYCYSALRVTLYEAHTELEKMLHTAGIQVFGDWNAHLDGRTLNLDRDDHTLRGIIGSLPFAVAFQIESMLLKGLLEHRQLPIMVSIVEKYDPSQSSAVADAMASFAQETHHSSRDSALLDGDITTTFMEHLTNHLTGSTALPTETKLGWFRCHRVTITPTSKQLQGPFIDQGNRIIRR
jgi:hypothetical protein